MKQFAILRVGTKFHQLAELAKVTAHNARTRKVGNADAERRGENRVLVGTGDAVADVAAMLETVPTKGRRKDSVIAFETLTTVSAEWWNATTEAERDAWIAAQLPVLEELFGKGNCATAWYHGDEAVGHAHWIWVPIDREGERKRGPKTRLNAKRWLGGPEKLTQLQDDYALHMAPHGLVRGRARSGARHKPAKVWQAEQVAAAEAAWKAAEAARAATSEAMAERKRARALRVGVEAVSTGLIVGAKQADDGAKLIVFAPKADPAVVEKTSRRIAVVWDEVWELARRLEERGRRIAGRARDQAEKLVGQAEFLMHEARKLTAVLPHRVTLRAEHLATSATRLRGKIQRIR